MNEGANAQSIERNPMSFSEIRSHVLSRESFNRNPISDEEYLRQASLARSNLANLFPDGVYQTLTSIPLAAETSLDHFHRTQEHNITSLRQIISTLAATYLTSESADWFLRSLPQILSEEIIYNNLIPVIGTIHFKDSHTLTLERQAYIHYLFLQILQVRKSIPYSLRLYLQPFTC